MEFFLLGPENSGKSYLMKCLQKKLHGIQQTPASRLREIREAEMKANMLVSEQHPPSLPFNSNEATMPTIGVDIVDFTLDGREFKITELGGSLVSGWPSYYKVAQAFIYLIDIADPGMWPPGIVYLREILAHKSDLANKPFLVILNKTDLTDSLTVLIGRGNMNLDSVMAEKDKSKIFAGSCFEESFIDQIIDWIRESLCSENISTMN